ncbi:hypothetical protein JOC85_003071 [Bacillus mesophilus]|uniref:Iron-containing alcohol dehydrogenase n=1 Tax=Bacillus mesophilus TaxID=1808955 RepID=A0A6M0QC52_9BACI|nr:iron-containing alcohol dehydrogenase [Bacillus mesophilus]MBM7662264.1 hypothetical protein [Bacillus mesophilus]NEY73100.1 iron-containing alcohol dehydrogenase [Bacillus mesophilus]
MEEKVIDMEYLTKYVSRELGISIDIINQIFDSEFDYYSALGLVEDESSSSDELGETNVVYMDELIDFINNRTNIPKTIIESVLDEEDKYMKRLDLIEGL